MNNQSYHTGRVNEQPDAYVNAPEVNDANMPVTPLPNPGEGGLVDNGNPSNEGSNIPVVPLPNPGEGGPLPGSNNTNSNRPGFPPIFRPVFPGGGGTGGIGSISGIGGIGAVIPGGGVAVIPGITFPCYSCTSNSFGRVRFLNAATGYQPFYVYLGNWLVANGLGNGDITSYVQAASGAQTVTIAGANGYTYIQKSIQIRASSTMTIAIINTTSGLDLVEISDISCNAPSGTSCLRTCNLSPNLGPFDVSIGNQSTSYAAFSNVRYREVTPYTSFYPGWYQLYISRTGAYPANTLATAAANMSANTSYTLYIFNAPNSTDGLRTMVVSS